MKLACVVHRFGADIAGGSEAHCRHVAEHLAAEHDVTILTSCARDHISWRNEYTPGESTLGRLAILRFPVARQRSMQRFAAVSEHAGWGYFDYRRSGDTKTKFTEGYQSVPVDWTISHDRKRGFFNLLSEITGTK